MYKGEVFIPMPPFAQLLPRPIKQLPNKPHLEKSVFRSLLPMSSLVQEKSQMASDKVVKIKHVDLSLYRDIELYDVHQTINQLYHISVHV